LSALEGTVGSIDTMSMSTVSTVTLSTVALFFLLVVFHELMESAFTGVVLGQFFGLLGQVLWRDAWRSHDKLVNGTIQLLLLGPCWGSTFTTAHVLDICLTTFKVKVGSVDITFILDLSALLAVELESFSSSSLKQRFTSRSKST
jgi:hypothetical protein